jgi:hypothetical protein
MMTILPRRLRAALLFLAACSSETRAFATSSPPPGAAAAASKSSYYPSFLTKKGSLKNQSTFLQSTSTSGSEERFGDAVTEVSNKETKIFSFASLRKVSNFASFLCVLDCTILPVITVLLPLLGILNLGASQLEFFHHLGHQLALYFVLPVGGLTTVVNFIGHKKKWITALASIGLVMVGVANSHWHHWPIVGGHVPHWIHMIQHGLLHRLVNISGCAFLLSANYISQQQPGCAHGHACGHDHSHAHHNHDH